MILHYRISLYILFVIIFSSINGCSIERLSESGAQPHGSLYVATVDEADIELEDAIILIDGAERPEKTPAYIHGVGEGLHDVIVKLFGYWSDTSAVEVVGGDTTSISFTLQEVPPDDIGMLRVDSNPVGARLLIDGQTYLLNDSPVPTPATIELPWGIYSVSVHLADYATIQPLLPHIALSAAETTDVQFTLETRETAQQIGSLPFDFTLENLSGDYITLSDLTGYVVLLNFWYADCVPCINEFPGIDSVYTQRAAEGFRVLAVNPMFPDDREEVRRVRDQMGLSFQLLLDWDRHVTTELYNVNVFPRNILIDRTGTINAIMVSVERDELDQMVTELLSAGENQ